MIGYEVLSPPDLEKTFGLTGGVSEIKIVRIKFESLCFLEHFPRSTFAGPTVHDAGRWRVWPLRPFHPSQESAALRKRRPPWRRRHGLGRKNGRPPGNQNAQISIRLKMTWFDFANIKSAFFKCGFYYL